MRAIILGVLLFIASLPSSAFAQRVQKPAAAAAKIEASELKSWSAAELTANAQRNTRFCELHPWDLSWLGPIDKIAREQNLVMVGDDLAMYRSNTNGLATVLMRLAAESAVSGDVVALKAELLAAAEGKYFTRITPYRPKSWEGMKPDWIGWYASQNYDAEPAFYGSLFMLQTAIPYALVRDSLTSDEDKLIRGWIKRIYTTVINAKKTLMATEAKRRDAPDIRATYAGAFVAWGGLLQDKEMFTRGASLFQEGVGRIRADGTEMFFANGTKPGLELKYQNFTYGGLAIAAHLLHRNGIDAYRYAPKGGISLAETLKLHLEATYDPSKRKRIQKQQDMLYFEQTKSHGDQTFAYLELVAADGTLQSEFLTQALDRRTRAFPPGFYGGHHGGYTTCFFASAP